MAQTQIATFGGGCFWCIESAFNQLKGVVSAVSGYSGGSEQDATYQRVCSGETEHAEVAHVEFDPSEIRFEQLLEVFFQLHDPTQLNRQGNDVGPQYRSVIFYHDEMQQEVSQTVINKLQQHEVYAAPIVTQLCPFERFFPAENYHQGYAENNPNQPYCAFIVLPKLNVFRSKFSELLK